MITQILLDACGDLISRNGFGPTIALSGSSNIPTRTGKETQCSSGSPESGKPHNGGEGMNRDIPHRCPSMEGAFRRVLWRVCTRSSVLTLMTHGAFDKPLCISERGISSSALHKGPRIAKNNAVGLLGVAASVTTAFQINFFVTTTASEVRRSRDVGGDRTYSLSSGTHSFSLQPRQFAHTHRSGPPG